MFDIVLIVVFGVLPIVLMGGVKISIGNISIGNTTEKNDD